MEDEIVFKTRCTFCGKIDYHASSNIDYHCGYANFMRTKHMNNENAEVICTVCDKIRPHVIVAAVDSQKKMRGEG